MWVPFLALIIVAITHWIYKWRNPKCSSGKLPPGSMGLPLIGETIQFFIPSKSIDIPSFAKKRMKRYGPVFKTSLAGRPVVVSSDADFSHFILQQEGKLVELWYMDTLANILGQNGYLQQDSTNAIGVFHKRIKKLIADYFGPENLKDKLLPELEELASQTLATWSCQDSVDIKHECSKMILNFISRHLFGYDPQKHGSDIYEIFTIFTQGLMSFPVNIPGTTYYKCMEAKKKLFKMINDTMKERLACPEARREDFLDHLIDDMKADNLLTENVIPYAILCLLLATFETVPTTLAVAIKLLAEHPPVLQELWVINESLRISSIAIGILRKSIQDIHVNGYVIPKGWTIIVLPSAIHLNPETYQDPLDFNPWRWEDLGSNVSAKNFIPFGGGLRSCGGAEFSKVLIAAFFHVLVIKYRWSKLNGGDIVRAPNLGFGNGYHIKVSKLST